MNAPTDLLLPATCATAPGSRLLQLRRASHLARGESALQQLLRSSVSRIEDRYTGHFKGFHLSSAFQPIFALTHRRAVGYEALLRVSDADGKPLSPLEVFAHAADGEETVQLDRTSRVLHTHNFRSLAANDNWLFLNINPHVVVEGRLYGSFFAELLHSSGLQPSQVVVEILENAILDEGLLAEAVQYYKELGCLVAIDDFGAGHSNFDRIVRLAPNMVKLDRSFLQQARQSSLARRMLPNLIALLHEAGCLVVLEGIEDETEALLAIEAGADFAQGYYFARPAAADAQNFDSEAVFGILGQRSRAALSLETQRREANLREHIQAFRDAANTFADGTVLREAAASMTGNPHVVRCYVLDEHGVQVGSNVLSGPSVLTNDPRFRPLQETSGCDWSGRHYFRRALGEPGVVQVTRPYLSITGAHMTTTLSMAIRRDGKLFVMCCDLNLPEALPAGT